MRIDPHVLDAIKGMDLPKLMQGYGLELKPAGKNAYQARCPFHDDKTPSLSVGFRNNKWIWNCFGCHTHGNYLDFQMSFEKIPFSDAYQKSAASLSAGGVVSTNGHGPHAPPPHAPAVATSSTMNRGEFLTRAVQIYHEAFQEDRRGADYLVGRGIHDGELFKRHQVGFVNGRLRRLLPEDQDHEFVRGLKEAGILNEKGTERFYNCVVFPILDENGGVVGLYGRSVRRGWLSTAEHLYLPGPHRGVWNGAAIKAHGEILLAESIIDALSAQALGFMNAVPIYGTNGLTEDHLRLFQEHRTRRVCLCLDNDGAGERARGPIREKLAALGIEVRDLYLPRQFKDMNEALKRGMTAEELRGRMAAAEAIPTTDPAAQATLAALILADEPTAPSEPVEIVTTGEAPVPSTEERPAEGRWPRVERKSDGIFIQFPERLYRVSGLTAKTRLRVTLRVEQGGEDHPDGRHLDSLDLYSAKSRQIFVGACRKVLRAEEGELLKELNQIIEALEAIPVENIGGAEEAAAVTPEEAAEALAALESPTLLKDVLGDMDAVGYVGEEHNKAIGYLVGTSRKLEDPLSCSIISQSSAGKSVLADTVEKMMPPEDILSLSRATPHAFFYIVKDGIKHKLVIMEERSGAEQADYAIRTLQSKKKLSQMVTIKDETTGDMKAKFFEVDGPVAYIETTTNIRIHDENATRCFEINLDESLEQTRRIQHRQRESKTLDGLKRKAKADRILRRHHNMQRFLKPVKVVIGYALLIEFPARWLRTRRDNLRFLNLIEVISFLHQRQRERKKTADGVDYIEATLSDYDAAYALAKAVMGESFAELKRPQRELLKVAEGLAKRGDFTRRQLREATGIGNTRLREILGELVAMEYVIPIEGGAGKSFRYRLGDQPLEEGRGVAGLTTPEDLARKLAIV